MFSAPRVPAFCFGVGMGDRLLGFPDPSSRDGARDTSGPDRPHTQRREGDQEMKAGDRLTIHYWDTIGRLQPVGGADSDREGVLVMKLPEPRPVAEMVCRDTCEPMEGPCHR